jgi:GNAT superfamily N-acetyltransferase
MATSGAQVVPAKVLETLRLLQDTTAADLGVLDESLGDWMTRPLGREALASVVLPTNGSLYLALMNFESAGLMLLSRGELATRIRALIVAEDMRRRGLARTLLEAADEFVREANLAWLWMEVPNDNVPATACALSCGYRRFRPQFLRRERSTPITLSLGRAHVEVLEGNEANQQLAHWMAVAAEQGDVWCKHLALADLSRVQVPETFRDGYGKTYLLVSGADEVGVAHLSHAMTPNDKSSDSDTGPQSKTPYHTLWLWLDKAVWNTERELNVLKSVLDTLVEFPARLDIELGSHDHLRTSIGQYKALGFAPKVRDRVIFVKSV